jgi:secreted trypsin-like serine protease
LSPFRRVAVAAALALVALPAAAGAVTNGTLDGSAHPAVGLLVAGPDRTPVCSGTLVAPTVFLTAGHCVAHSDGALAVRFDTGVVEATGAAVEPGYGKDTADLRDLAVVTLAQAPAGIVPALLAPTDAADSLGHGDDLTVVGYGYYARVTGGGQPRYLYDGLRRVGLAPVANVGRSLVRVLDSDAATGESGLCFGDSGGPWLVDGTIVAVTSGGDSACSGMSYGYRVDTPSARAFLAQYLP